MQVTGEVRIMAKAASASKPVSKHLSIIKERITASNLPGERGWKARSWTRPRPIYSKPRSTAMTASPPS